MPATLVMMTRSPTRAPAAVTRPSRGTSPCMSPATMGCLTAGEISVCPPVTAMPSPRALRSMSRKIRSTVAGVVRGGTMIVDWNQAGRAPITATSLALT